MSEDTKTCKYCSKSGLPKEANHCTKCGSPLENRCTVKKCGKINPDDASYCMYCGEPTWKGSVEQENQ